jgi:hypothetical protein
MKRLVNWRVTGFGSEWLLRREREEEERRK